MKQRKTRKISDEEKYILIYVVYSMGSSGYYSYTCRTQWINVRYKAEKFTVSWHACHDQFTAPEKLKIYLNEMVEKYDDVEKMNNNPCHGPFYSKSMNYMIVNEWNFHCYFRISMIVFSYLLRSWHWVYSNEHSLA